MRHFFYLAIIPAAGLLILLGASLGRSEDGADEKQTAQNITGAWRVESILKSALGGAKADKGKDNKPPAGIIFFKDKVMMYDADNNKLSETSYTISKTKIKIPTEELPSTISMKFQGKEMKGVFEVKDNKLSIGLDDAKKRKPKTADAQDYDVRMILNRYWNQPLMIINADGTNMRPLMNIPGCTCGSSAWSYDGKKIVADTWNSFLGEDYSKSHLYIANADGSDPKDLGDGTLPSFSPDGKQIAFSRYRANQGIWTMDADGSKKRHIDPSGWSAAWSPTNQDEIAYSKYSENGVNLCVRNLKTNEVRNLLNERYRQVMWGLVWTPDGQWILFKGILPDGAERMAMVSAEGQETGFKTILPSEEITGIKSFETCFSFSPDAKQVVLSMTMEGDGRKQIYIIDVDGSAPPRRLEEQKRDWGNYTPAWSPDGKTISFAY